MNNQEQRLSYDAWGNLRYPRTWENYPIGDPFAQPLFDRGFTGHEHLWNFGLINMNGRMYDPLISSFLSADRFLQDPSSTQGFNRYAYCMHNPLRYVDPSGWMSGPPKSKQGLIQDYLSDPCNITRQQLREAGMYNIEGGYGWSGEHGSMRAGWMEADGLVHTSEWYVTTTGGGFDAGAWAIPSSFYSMWVNDCKGLCSYGYNNCDNIGADIGVGEGQNHGTGRGGGNWGGKTNQYYVNKIGYLPLDVNNPRGYAALQSANFKMLYNVSLFNIFDFTANEVKKDQLYLTVRGLSSHTLVIGDVKASAKAFLFVEGTLMDSQPLKIDLYESVINPINTSYIGSASFVIPTTDNIVLKIKGGWSVYSGSGWTIPTISLFGPPINANLTIQINTSIQ